MLLFAADDHFKSRAGAVIYEALADKFNWAFHENDWNCFDKYDLDKCDLIVLHMIAGSCGMGFPDEKAERVLRAYAENGGSFLLLHGSSAAFWAWPWWRKIVGFRWVRSGDPDGIMPSTHPVKAFSMKVAKARHPLCGILKNFEMPQDEIYINLEQVCPSMILLETTIEEGTFPQCSINQTPWDGEIINFLPGHSPAALRQPAFIETVKSLIEYLLERRKFRHNMADTAGKWVTGRVLQNEDHISFPL